MLLWVGHCGAGHHKAEVGVVPLMAEPLQAPEHKSCVTAKDAPAHRAVTT